MDVRKAREALEQFVTHNISHLRSDFFTAVAPDVNANDQEDCLSAYVRTNNPYVVLEKCFASLRLALLAVDQLDIDSNLDLQGRELIDAMLETEELGFIKEVEPEGLFQIRENLESCLKRAEDEIQLEPNDVRGSCVEMAQAMEKLLDKLFLFHSYISLPNAGEKAENIEKLCQDYKKRQMKTLGSYIGFLKCLMSFVQKDEALRNYYQKNFQHEVPLDPNQIAEIRMFTKYRNLIIHSQDDLSWEKDKKRVETYLNEMNDDTRKKWEESWNNVVGVYESQQPSPPETEMIQRMVRFFREFLNLLSENQIYPKVIVMRSYTVDDYGTRQITAIDDADETVFLADEDFVPFTEFYCHSHANSFGIEPILVPKQELEKWATQTDDVPKEEET